MRLAQAFWTELPWDMIWLGLHSCTDLVAGPVSLLSSHVSAMYLQPGNSMFVGKLATCSMGQQPWTIVPTLDCPVSLYLKQHNCQ